MFQHNKYEKYFNFSTAVYNKNEKMIYDPAWMNDEQKMINYLAWLWKHTDRNRDDADMLYNICCMAIEQNNIPILEMAWQSTYYFDRDTPYYTPYLLHSAKHSNLQTFMHCLYAYNNCSSDSDYVKYDEFLAECKDPEIRELVVKLKDVIDEKGNFNNEFSDSLDPKEIIEEGRPDICIQWAARVEKYRQIIK